MYIIYANLDSCHQINLTGCANVFIFYMNRAKVFEGHAAFSEKKGKVPSFRSRINFRLGGSCSFTLQVVCSGQLCITILFNGMLL